MKEVARRRTVESGLQMEKIVNARVLRYRVVCGFEAQMSVIGTEQVRRK